MYLLVVVALTDDPAFALFDIRWPFIEELNGKKEHRIAPMPLLYQYNNSFLIFLCN
jgi:hypothetical protein